jgi:hypothetical protein
MEEGSKRKESKEADTLILETTGGVKEKDEQLHAENGSKTTTTEHEVTQKRNEINPTETSVGVLEQEEEGKKKKKEDDSAVKSAKKKKK